MRYEKNEFVQFDGQDDCKAEPQNERVQVVFGLVHGSPFKKMN